MNLVKAHAYGNDFLLLEEQASLRDADLAALARSVCDRHRGVGGDGLIAYRLADGRAAMRLLNADGSYSELSGNGIRCLAAWIAATTNVPPGRSIEIDTDAGRKTLRLLDRAPNAFTFRAAMGSPERVERVTLEAGGRSVDAVTLRVGNPQCVVLGAVNPDRLHTIAAALAVHPHFPEGTNVELATVDAPDRVRILIWERGVGPTEASGTGACAAAVAAASFGGASRDVQVIAPGGLQRVEWTDEGLYLTGSATIIAEITYRW